MKTQSAIAFKLRLVEPLVGCGLMWKVRLTLVVLQHVLGLITREGSLEVEQVAGVVFVVFNSSDGTMSLTPAGLRVGAHHAGLNIDFDAKVRAALSKRISQVFECVRSIFAGITGNDVRALPPNEFVDAKVLEVASVGEIDVIAFVIGQSQQFHQPVN